MDWKYLREYHNRQDKATKTVSHIRSSSGTKHVSKKRFKNDLKEKDQLIKDYQKTRYVFENRYLKLNWDRHTYAQKNNMDIQDPETKRIFEAHLSVALSDFEVILKQIRISVAKVRFTLKDGFQLVRSFKAIIQCQIEFEPRLGSK